MVCGDYIGFIGATKDGYKKRYSRAVGKYRHDSKELVEARRSKAIAEAYKRYKENTDPSKAEELEQAIYKEM